MERRIDPKCKSSKSELMFVQAGRAAANTQSFILLLQGGISSSTAPNLVPVL